MVCASEGQRRPFEHPDSGRKPQPRNWSARGRPAGHSRPSKTTAPAPSQIGALSQTCQPQTVQSQVPARWWRSKSHGRAANSVISSC